jgi:hypothetical protein
LHFGVEASEIEAVENVILLDFAKIFVTLGGEEPGNPGAIIGVFESDNGRSAQVRLLGVVRI